MRRVLWCAVLGILLLGLVGSVPAAPTRRGIGTPRAVHGSRAATAQRGRWIPASLPVESLELPRPGLHLELPDPGPAPISAASAVLMNGETGEVLFTQNPDEPLPPASITKILTGLVILEHGRLAEPVVVSRAAARTGGYRLGLQRGQQISLGDLLAAILIRSANDAAVAAAEHVGGNLQGFVALMNAKAREIGMTQSRFANPHGLDEREHYTTARDMAQLTRVALDHPTFARLVRTLEAKVTISKPSRRKLVARSQVIQNHNRLLEQFEGADGVKTGYTRGAGRSLVASATRDDQRMIAVLLNDPNRWTDAAALLEYGFTTAGKIAAIQSPSRPLRIARLAGGRG